MEGICQSLREARLRAIRGLVKNTQQDKLIPT